MASFNKILVANRGEIACRVIRTARDQGYRSVAVYSEADAHAPHVALADEAVCIGPAPVGESYLVADRVIEAALKTGADAIHPGYGILAENAGFAGACANAGLVFIGPPASAIELMGSKRLSKIAMLEAGVPCIPGYQGAEQDDETLLAEAVRVGFPLMVKASAGGGGRGMRLVMAEGELAEQIKTARSEATNAFGSGELILERAVLEPRHIEIQVFADNHGNVVYLGERDCSIQRRHQKVVEEAPSPFVDPKLRQCIGEAAVNAARACDYRGAGTVEFLVDKDKNFYFLEMNTRLQVEHPVTEMVTGQDLVAWQLAVAAGEPLPLSQDRVELNGHAVEVRIYAEDPRQQFLPQTGQVLAWQTPQRDGIRCDSGITEGSEISPFYDPMIAKLIAYGATRSAACRKLASAVEDSQLLGVNNNRLFLQNILRSPAFIAGDATTAFLDQHFAADASMEALPPSTADLALAAALLFRPETGGRAAWHNPTASSYRYRLGCGEELFDVAVSQRDDHVAVQVCEDTLEVSLLGVSGHTAMVCIDGIRSRIAFAIQGQSLWLDAGRGHYRLDNLTHAPAASLGAAGSGQLKSSMDGAVVAINVANGDLVSAGQTLVIIEAMKMEHPLKAGIDGVVSGLVIAVGDQVKSKQLLLEIEAGG